MVTLLKKTTYDESPDGENPGYVWLEADFSRRVGEPLSSLRT
jgi:hypothetical protein